METVREVLEKFLDDDEDMHDMNLTANQVQNKAGRVKKGFYLCDRGGWWFQ